METIQSTVSQMEEVQIEDPDVDIVMRPVSGEKPAFANGLGLIS